MKTIKSLNSFFEEELEDLPTDPNTKSYVISIFSKFKNAQFDLSNESITIQFGLARFNNDFSRFQNLGDYLFFSFTLFPEHLNNASPEYYCSIAQLSYHRCFRLLRNEWKCFERLADEFKPLTEQTRDLLHLTHDIE